MIQLRDDVSSRGMLGLRAECNTQSMPVSTAGYPSDKPNYGSRTWFTWGQMNNVNGCGMWSRDAIATSTLDVAGGQSGSPMFHIVNGELVIRAILIASSPTTTFHRTVDRWAGACTVQAALRHCCLRHGGLPRSQCLVAQHPHAEGCTPRSHWMACMPAPSPRMHACQPRIHACQPHRIHAVQPSWLAVLPTSSPPPFAHPTNCHYSRVIEFVRANRV